MDGIALAVAEHLHLDMARPLDIELGIDAAVAEIALASLAAMRAASASSAAERTMLMPLPPPPAAALISSGKPIFAAAAREGVEIVRSA